MVDKNDSLLREVEEELRHDQLRKLWAENGTYIIAAVGVFILGVFGYQQVQQSRLAASQAAGAKFETARQLVLDKKPTEAMAALNDIAVSGPGGYAALARLELAGTHLKADEPDKAVADYDALVADAGADPALRDFARLQAAGIRLAAADWTEIENRLTPLTDERNAFRIQARELLGLAAQKYGHVEDARKLFLQVISDGRASQPVKERVSSYLASMVAADLAKSAAPAASKPATTGAGTATPAETVKP